MKLHNSPTKFLISSFYQINFNGSGLIIGKFVRLPNIGGRSNVKLSHFPINNKDPSKILKIFELKVHLIR